MTDVRTLDLVSQSIRQATGNDAGLGEGGHPPLTILQSLTEASSLTPPWWSQRRDMFLGRFWQESPHLSIAVYAAQAKLIGIPIKVVARNPNISSHVEAADAWNERMMNTSEFGQTLHDALAKFYQDYLTQDNGGFMEIIGEGNSNGPIVGRPLAVRHLDSQRCMRTSNPEYPIIYTATDGKRYRFHWTRVLYRSQMPSPRREMHGVGFCAVSRAIEMGHTMLDIVRYKQQRLGSMPANQLLLGKGILARQIMGAFRMAEEEMRNRGFSRYARTIAMGSESTDVDIERIDLNHLEPFDEETSTMLAMALIASAFGLDLGEVWMSESSGSSEEARIRNSRTRGKLPAQVSREMTTQINLKLLPPYLEAKFDFRDDEEDQQRAVIRDIRGRSRERDLGSQAITVRAARKQMLKDGEIDRETFITMELEHGRLESGAPIATLFFDEHPDYLAFLNLGVESPLAFVENDAEDMLVRIDRAFTTLYREWANTGSQRKSIRLKESAAALDWLRDQYEAIVNRPEVNEDEAEESPDDDMPEREETEEGPPPGRSSMGQTRKPGTRKGIWAGLDLFR